MRYNQDQTQELSRIKSIEDKCHRNFCSQQVNEGKQPGQKINVAIVSDFYYPFVGGVQIHIKELATLLNKHEKVGNLIIITHKYDDHQHRYIGQINHHGFRVYYLNVHYNKQHMITYPTFVFNFREAARILRSQKIHIVHCHQSGSPLALQFIFFARVLGLKAILTEHSLYGLRSISDIHFNRVSQLFVPLCDKVIAVSKTTRNNILVRANIDPEKVVVIPNGVSSVSHFTLIRKQKRALRSRDKVKIISVGRMTYRRGTDLLIEILPQLCLAHQNIQVLIVGDGGKRGVLEKIIQIHNLHSKVKLLGVISDHQKLLQTMSDCDIFLNTPLTQSFGIALAEAAMLGLYCVSTNVGGVEEAIPKHCLFPAKVEPNSLLNILTQVIDKARNQKSFDEESKMDFSYPWPAVSERTVQLYDFIIRKAQPTRKDYFLKTLRTRNFLQLFFCFLGFVLYLVQLLPSFI